MNDMDMLNNKKKKTQFTIINDDSTDGHGGYGVGTITMSNVSPVIIDVEEQEAYIDLGAMHAKSAIEKRIKFLKNKDEVPNGKQYWFVWVTVDHKNGGPYYAGVAACELLVDLDIRRGYKNLADHVNKLDKSMKKKIVVDELDASTKSILKNFLQAHDQDMWELSEEELKQALDVD